MGGRLHEREERKLRRACCVSGEVASLLGSVWTVSGRLSSELYAMCSRAVAAPVQPHPRLAWCWLMHGRAVARAGGTQA